MNLQDMAASKSILVPEDQGAVKEKPHLFRLKKKMSNLISYQNPQIVHVCLVGTEHCDTVKDFSIRGPRDRPSEHYVQDFGENSFKAKVVSDLGNVYACKSLL